MADYTQITNTDQQKRIRARYRHQISSLEALGFQHLAYCLEALGPYSVLLNLPVLLLAFNKEVIVFLRPLRLAVGNALLFHADPSTISLCMGLGVKLYSYLPNGTILISSDFHTQARPRPGAHVVRLSPFPSIEATWRAHRDRVASAYEQRPAAPESPSFHQYVGMSRREEELSQYE